MSRYRCSVCNWVYDEQKEADQFKDLAHSYNCPVCGAPKNAFSAEGLDIKDATVTTSVADKIIEQLVAFGVRFVYGIPGDSNLPLVDAIRRNKNIRFILTRHEETAAFMASAHGKMTDTLGVCTSIAGPGCTNLITGLMDAQTDRSPVLALAGQVPEVYLGSEAFQEIDQIELFRPFTEYAETIARPSQAIKLVVSAVKYAYKKPAVSVLSTPTDILVEKLADPIQKPSRRLFQTEVGADSADIKRAADLINRTARVAVLAGWGSRHASEFVLKLVEKIRCPLVTTSRAKGRIDENHPLCAGVLGSIGSKHAALAIKDCELVLIVGSGFRQANLIATGIRAIQIDSDATRIGKTFPIDVGLVGAARPILEELLPLVSKKEGDGEFLARVEKAKSEHGRELKKEGETFSKPIHPGLVIQSLKKCLAEDSIICVDVGDHTYWFYKKFITEGQKTYMSANIASMGFALPAALAAKLNFPDRQVVGVSGDGGFAMLMADFTTAVREKLDITLVVFNDGKLKNIKKEQLRDNYQEYGTSFPNPDFAAFARSAGGEGYRVEEAEDLLDSLRSALASSKPAIVDILVDADLMAHSTKRIN